MSGDNFTEVTNQSWFSRIGGALKGIIVGFLLFIASFVLLFWNEGRSVKTYKTLKEGSGSVISISNESVNPANEGKLVHLSGLANTTDTLRDEEFGISTSSIKLKRSVKMYQWKESKESKKKKKIGGGTTTTTTYSYSKAWSSSVINSSDFKNLSGHENPNVMPYQSFVKNAQNVKLGGFELSQSLIEKINRYDFFPVDKNLFGTETDVNGFKIVEGKFYKGNDISNPAIGDLQIEYNVVNNTDVSLIAAQKDFSFIPYETSVGGVIQILETGTHTANEMFQQAQKSNKIMTWILRAVGFLLMFIGLRMMFGVLSVVADILPILGSIVSAGLGLISFLVALVFSILTIAIAWITYRPVLGISLLVVVIAFSILLGMKLKKK